MWRHSKAQTGQGKSELPHSGVSSPPMEVLSRYGWSPQNIRIVSVPPGFSGALVWQAHHQRQIYAIKCWPPGHPVHLSLSEIHQWMQMARNSGLKMIPAVLSTNKGEGFVSHQDRLWEVTTWQPGEPDSSPNDERLRNSIQFLAQLHALWKTAAPGRVDPCPAVQLQAQRLSSWTPEEFELLNARKGSVPILHHAVSLFVHHRQTALERLKPWLTRKFPLQPCLADIWSDHVLFTGNEVTGVIDFGAMRFDHPAQDLARLIGSYAQGNPELRARAIASYLPSSQELEKLTIMLDDAGVVVGLGNWLRWLLLEQRPMNQMKALSRIHWLVGSISRRLPGA